MKSKSCLGAATVSARSSLVDARPLCAGQTPTDEYLDTLKCDMPQMQALFEKLGRAEHPDFMTVWLAISQMVAFYTEPRPIFPGPGKNAENGSGKKCRFCP